jgi:23S rRNA (uracil1939-C5)-methyltransferase
VVLDLDNNLKLKNQPPAYWFSSFDDQSKSLPIKCHISSFTQPSWISGQKLIEAIRPWINSSKKALHILEFGAGVGFFTSYFLSAGHKVTALEIENSAEECLLANIPKDISLNNLKIITGDFHKIQYSPESKVDFSFVNPARAGLKSFCQNLINLNTDKVIYVSCFPESMVKDLNNLSSHYKIRNIIIVDQFPQTPHYETCVLLEKLS